MNLFDNLISPARNILPCDGVVEFHGTILSKQEADYYFKHLLDLIQWQHDEAIIFGKRIITKRKVAWYADSAFAYTYSNTTRYALPWIEVLKILKEKVEKCSGETYNSCLLNLYHNGEEGMAWHRDAEKDLKKNGAIASLSLGAERKFGFKHISGGKPLSISLPHGSLLVMKGSTQTFWLHHLPKSKKIKSARINLTFRMVEINNNI